MEKVGILEQGWLGECHALRILIILMYLRLPRYWIYIKIYYLGLPERASLSVPVTLAEELACVRERGVENEVWIMHRQDQSCGVWIVG